ncbi:hypothetical protein OG2516_03443 [Oceanicola granulosus HTCC2516]|uniref:AAA+ family ATPase n=1 Tax=Oceanicola granulosus (strain ATCC BAA-861 / DSM 15982 / KCTC 12143 / HTCC2516) TaxID=314256 RepID=Q2CAJ7_OCEGH|nr:hypothetical protein [Oceanicola granulosus]EAR49677.1 hypothetical protein OG2516_03443 [Oceanicola granulosus HTCC2516]
MKRLILSAALSLALLPAHAQQDDPPANEPVEDGLNLMEEGAKLLFRGLLNELEPALDDLEGLSEEMRDGLRLFADEMGPAIVEMMRLIDEITYYERPEILPNGDIIIRRRPDAPPWEAPDDAEYGPDGAIEL